MKQMTFDEIYAANDAAQEELEEILAGVNGARIGYIPPSEKWSVEQVVEHLSLVEDGIYRICVKLLGKARDENRPAAGFAVISDSFIEGTRVIANEKREAPEIVSPKGRGIDESLATLREIGVKLGELRPLFDACDSESFKFPHPFFGEMSAAEWLLLAGGHKSRHIQQIRKLIELSA